MSNIQKDGKDKISLEIDEGTQKALLKDTSLAKTIGKVFDAVWGMNDKIKKALDEKKQD